MTPNDKAELQIAEDKDGSAIVQLPENEENPQQPQGAASLDDDDDSSDTNAEAASSMQSAADDPAREAVREARREERKLKKVLHREKARESNHLVSALRKQNGEMAGRIAALEAKTSGAEMARLSKAIDDAGTRVEYAKMKMQEAVNNRNGEEVTRSQQLWYDNQRELESLQAMKTNADKQLSRPVNNIKLPDPEVQRMAADWMTRHKWYNPQLKDADSKVAQSLDQTLTEEGYDPSSADYWEELDERLQKYLPHRYNTGYSHNTNPSRPGSAVTSSGRESSSSAKPNEYRLTPDRVAAMKEAGIWNDVEQRNKMARKYAEYDRQQKRG